MRPKKPNIKACGTCGHGAGIHRYFTKQKTFPCNYPGCKCKQYVSPTGK